MDLSDQLDIDSSPPLLPNSPQHTNFHTNPHPLIANPPKLPHHSTHQDQQQSFQSSISTSTITTMHKPHGKLKIIYTSTYCLFNLGPDYFCFLVAFVFFCTVSFLITRLVFSANGSFFMRVVTIVVSWGYCMMYFLVATSDPGIAYNTQGESGRLSSLKNCKKCGHKVPRNTQHCHICDVCIIGMDHHCPWVSKCIGHNNLIRFYLFLGWTPCYLVYVMITFMFYMSDPNITQLTQMPRMMYELI